MSDFDSLVSNLAEGIFDEADPNALTLFISGEKLPCTSGRISRSIDTCADGFVVTARLDIEFEKYLFRPYGFENVELYLGSELVITGRLYKPRIDFSDTGYFGTFEGASFAADLVDSTLYPPREFGFSTLGEVVERCASQCNIEVDIQYARDDQMFIERATCGDSEKIFDFLVNLASQHGVLVTSNAKGNLCLVQANTKTRPVCVLGDDRNPLTTISGEWDGRQLFNRYKATITSPITVQSNTKKRKKKTYVTKTMYRTQTAVDDDVPESRQTSITCDEVSVGNAERAAKHLQKRAFADSHSIRVPVTSWYVPGTNQLWKENTIVTLQSKAVFLHNGYDMLIRSVQYVLSDAGTTAMLELVIPQCYSDDDIPRGIFSLEGPSGSITSSISGVMEEIS